MATPEIRLSAGSQSALNEPTPDPSSIPPPTRHDTVSTVSSEKGRPLSVDVWALSIHGNCPRCHHHHKPAVIKIKVPDGLGQAHDLRCDNCHKKWLTIGRRNSTQLSLLSTRTMTIDSEEEELRCTLINIVRSAMPATAIASPTLASVPESASQAPSRGNSVRAHHRDAIESVVEARPSSKLSLNESQTKNSSGSRASHHRTTPKASLEHKTRFTKAFEGLGRKFRDVFPVLKNMHLRKRLLKKLVNVERKLPTTACYEEQGLITPQTDQKPQTTDHNDVNRNCKPLKHDHNVCTPSKTLSEALESARKFDRDEIKRMNADERAAWVREKSTDWIRQNITDFKCRCTRHCSCRFNNSTSSLIFDGVRAQHREDEPRSQLFEGIGSHFNSFGPGQFFTGTSTVGTRTSEADTAVESHAGTSSPRSSRLDVAQRSRHRSWSPRPTSLATSRHSLHLRQQHDLAQRGSLDSIITIAAARSSSRGGRRTGDRRSITSLAPPPIPSRPDSAGASSHTERMTTDENDSLRTLQAHSSASTPHLNGDLTDDENNRESDVTPPRDMSNP